MYEPNFILIGKPYSSETERLVNEEFEKVITWGKIQDAYHTHKLREAAGAIAAGVAMLAVAAMLKK